MVAVTPFGLLVPPRCLACATVLRHQQTRTPPPLCGTCADGLEPDGEPHRLDRHVRTVAAHAYVGPLAVAIKQVKTGGLREGARALASLLVLPDLGCPVTWVPAPPGRRRRRGLDLPQVLAGPHARALLARTTDPPEQPDLDATQRLAAQHGTFRATTALRGPVVLVDDVRATGATLLAAATTLRQAGASRVLAVTLAAAGGPPSAVRRRGRGSSAAGSAPTW